MTFWPVAVLLLAVLVVFQLDETYTDALRQEGATERLVYLTLLLVVVLAYGLRFRRVAAFSLAKMGLIWAAIFAAAVMGYSYRDQISPVWWDMRAEISPTFAVARAEGVAELRKAADGHFRAVAKVNGQNVGMLIDTGASIVLLSYEDAVAAGLNPQNLSFSMPVTTANGRSKVAPVTLDNVTIGNVGLDTVRAAVARPGAIHSSLLGMSFLGRLQETSFRRDKLILKN